MGGKLRGLSLHQPGASRVAAGVYRLVNLGWSSPYRGALAIHASQSRAHVTAADGVHAFAFGAIVATARLTGIYPLRELPAEWRDDPYANGPFCWVLAEARQLKVPVPYQGKRWLWALDDTTRAEVWRRVDQEAAA